MAYNELIKNFEKIREYMRDFYVYGFKSRAEYSKKSLRSYDDERRRLESWLNEEMKFTQTPEGKNMFISIDSRAYKSNPLYKAWKSKSFTDGDITLHFMIFDILRDDDLKLTLSEIINEITLRLEKTESDFTFDDSTVRKKLKEYSLIDIINIEKKGKKVLYSRAESFDIIPFADAVDYFTEASPLGVVGSFIQNRLPERKNNFCFKHHYITGTMDSDILATLFDAMSKKSYVFIDNLRKNRELIKDIRIVPLKIYISTQNGRQNLLAYSTQWNSISSFRLDRILNVRIAEPCFNFIELRNKLNECENHIWGVNCRLHNHYESVEFHIKVGDDEQYIVNRLMREKRGGKVEKIGDNTYKFTVLVFDTNEMIPWIRTFISRITYLKFSNRTVENRFKNDIYKMYEMYGIGGENL